MSLGCSLVTAPIVWLEFGYLPLLGVPANALAEPAMPLLLALAFATAGLGLVVAGARPAPWRGSNGWVAAYIALCAHAIGSLPAAEVTGPRGLAAVVAVLLAGAYPLARRRRRA